MQRTPQIVVIPILYLFAAGAHALAPVSCVSTQGQFNQALAAVQLAPFTIELARGTYYLDTTVWHNRSTQILMANGSSLLGGYNPDCSTRTLAIGNTIVRDDTQTQGDGPSDLNNVLIEGITFYAQMSFGADVSASFSPNILIRRSAFLAGGSVDFSEADDLNDPGGIFYATVENSLFAGNDYGGVGCAIAGYSLGGEMAVTVINSTIVDNNGSGGVCAVAEGGFVPMEVYNSILWGNSGADVVSNSFDTQLVNNIVGTVNYPGTTFPPVNTLHTDPQLDSNYHPIEPTSPAIDSGTFNVPGGLPPHDLDGRPRVIGTSVDRGAFESSVVAGYVQTVRNTADHGVDSLRQAIINATANGSGIIFFNIGSGCGPHVIQLETELPDLTVPLTFLGYTQTGAQLNDLDYGFDASICVIIEPAANSNVQHAFKVPATASADTIVVVEGFEFGGFGFAPVDLRGGSGHFVSGNRFGVVNGGIENPNVYNVYLGPGVSDVTLGGHDPSQRNLILSATNAGVYLDAAADDSAAANHSQIVNNYIGMGWSNGHLVAHGNGAAGIHLGGYSNTIMDNLIGYNGGDGINIIGTTAHANVISGNTIGGTSSNDGNAGNGVTIQDAAHDNTIRTNTIDYNTLKGVRVATGQRNRISANYISGNGGLGIDIADAGYSPNDNDNNQPTADFGNRGQNFPDLTLAIGNLSQGRVSGTLKTLPGRYRIEVFGTYTCDASGHGEGAPFIASRTITVEAPQSGNENTASWSIDVSAPGAPLLSMPPQITATATDVVGNTSEFSACLTYINDRTFADGFDPAP